VVSRVKLEFLVTLEMDVLVYPVELEFQVNCIKIRKR
jgi:hypothetical protein